MAIQEFKIENLNELDGGKGLAMFAHLLKLAAHDCSERPAEAKARKVTLEVQLTPSTDQNGDCVKVWAKVAAKSTVPQMTTSAYSLGLRRGGMLVFNPDSPHNVDQSTFLDDEN